MLTRKCLLLLLVALTVSVFVVSVVPAQAAPSVKVKFEYSGITNIPWGTTLLTINGTNYAWNALPVTITCKAGDTLTVTAAKVADYNSNNYTLSTWTNGNGLTGSSGTLLVPGSDVTVTANYGLTTHTVTFAATGFSNYYGDLLIVDGSTISASSLNSNPPKWDAGTTHTITAITPITSSYPQNTYAFVNWTNGNGLIGSSGTFTMPNADVTLTVNYASTAHTATFAVTGLSNFNNYILKIDGTDYIYSDLASTTFNWAYGSTHSVQAITPVSNFDTPAKGYVFSNWTNGNGLTAASGTFTMPNTDVTVTANYVQSTVHVTFAHSGLSNINSGITILTIDNVQYDYWDVLNTNFRWEIGSTHTVVASTPITGWDNKVYQFSTWTNGNGLTGTSGTFTTPSTETTVTANYGSSTVSITFAASSIPNFSGATLTIDGTSYDYFNLPTFLWEPETTHTVVAASPIVASDDNVYRFYNWINGDGLSGASGTYTVPASSAAVTANYTKTTVTINFATTGLSNVNSGDPVLTIDGTAYDYFTLQWKTFLWETGTTHTVIATQSLTGWDSITHTFSSWTNGGTLSGSSGTYTTPSSNATVTVNYSSSSSGSLSTSLTISCNPQTVDNPGTMTVVISGTLTSSNVGVSGKTIVISYYDGSWNTIGSTSTQTDGTYTYNWTVPSTIANGQYALKAYFAGDSSYNECAATTGGCGNGGNLFVLPEYALGGLLALAACFTALALFRWRRNSPIKIP